MGDMNIGGVGGERADIAICCAAFFSESQHRAGGRSSKEAKGDVLRDHLRVLRVSISLPIHKEEGRET